jgi:Rrf2 family transcriptional regulator, iron-sulfur cluster assembly transcription factor
MFSRSSGYAIQALTYLAAQPSGRLVGAREIATTLKIPMPFLWKILRNLSEKKLVRSFKGVHGGYELARPAAAIGIHEVLAAGRDRDIPGNCVLGLAQCNDREPCPMHSYWKGVREQIEATIKTTTLADMAREMKRTGRKNSAR